MIGYSQQLVKANAKASKKLLGVQLGKECIKKGISVISVAEHFGVSRTAVYSWFTGQSEVALDRQKAVTDYIEYLKKA